MDRFEQLYNYQFLKGECSSEVRLDVTVFLFWLLFVYGLLRSPYLGIRSVEMQNGQRKMERKRVCCLV